MNLFISSFLLLHEYPILKNTFHQNYYEIKLFFYDHLFDLYN